MENEGAKATKKAAIRKSKQDHPEYYKKKALIKKKSNGNKKNKI